MRKKAPPRPYYGELEAGETFPSQAPKKKVAKKKPSRKPGKVKSVGFSKKVVKDIKTDQQKRRERHRKLLKSMD